MSAGQMNRQITLQTPTDGKDGSSVPTETFADFTVNPTVWAKKIEAARLERYRNRQTVYTDKKVFLIWYRDDITEKDRLVYEGLVYNIIGLAELGGYKKLEIFAGRTE